MSANWEDRRAGPIERVRPEVHKSADGSPAARSRNATAEPDESDIRDLLDRLGHEPETSRTKRIVMTVAAGALVVLASAGVGVGVTLYFGKPILVGKPAREAPMEVISDRLLKAPAPPPSLSAKDDLLSPRTGAIVAPVGQDATAKLAETARPDPAPPAAVPATHAPGPELMANAAPAAVARPEITAPPTAAAQPAAAVPPVAVARLEAAMEGASVGPKPAPSQSSEPDSARTVTLSEPEILAGLERAEAMLRNGDLSAARLFFQRIVDAGDKRGALGMARTYDPAFLARLHIRGLRPDKTAAQGWYARARSMTQNMADKPLGLR